MQQIKISEAVSTALSATNHAIQQGIVLFVIVFHIRLILSKMLNLHSCLNTISWRGFLRILQLSCSPEIMTHYDAITVTML